jgi:hypothetical protein
MAEANWLIEVWNGADWVRVKSCESLELAQEIECHLRPVLQVPVQVTREDYVRYDARTGRRLCMGGDCGGEKEPIHPTLGYCERCYESVTGEELPIGAIGTHMPACWMSERQLFDYLVDKSR